MTDEQTEHLRLERAGLGVSLASLAVGIAALCLNRKPLTKSDNEVPRMEEQRAKTKKEVNRARRERKQRYANDIRAYAVDQGYTGTVIVLNTREGERRYVLTPVDEAEMRKPRTRSWVAMSMNTRTGGDAQAVVCGSKREAEERALAMRRSSRSPYARQGVAQVDTSDGIDVPRYFTGDRRAQLREVGE